MNSKRIGGLVALAWIPLVSLGGAHADLIKVQFSGILLSNVTYFENDPGPPLDAAPAIGSLVSGYYLFDSSTAALACDTTPPGWVSGEWCTYRGAPKYVDVMLGNLHYSKTLGYGDIKVSIENDVDSTLGYPPARDAYAVGISDLLDGPDIDGFQLGFFQIALHDWPVSPDIIPDLVAGVDLLQTVPDLSRVSPLPGLTRGKASLETARTIYFHFSNIETRTDAIFLADLTSFSVVPEPATLALLGLGLAGLCVARRRKAA